MAFLPDRKQNAIASILLWLFGRYDGSTFMIPWDISGTPRALGHIKAISRSLSLRLYRSHILPCMQQSFHRQPSVKSIDVGINLRTIWQRLLKIYGEQRLSQTLVPGSEHEIMI